MRETRVLVVGEFYRHFKDKMYQIREIAYHSETKEKMVIYQAMYGDFQVYVRPYEMFISEVDHVKYPEIKQKYRFVKIEMTYEKAEKTSEKAEMVNTKVETVNTTVEANIDSGIDSKIYNEYEDEDQEGSADPRLLQFLDAETFEEKLNVLASLKANMDDRLINDIAISLDITVEEGPMDKRYDSLRSCLLAHVKYECNRLR